MASVLSFTGCCAYLLGLDSVAVQYLRYEND
jgi:hypothetical protein